MNSLCSKARQEEGCPCCPRAPRSWAYLEGPATLDSKGTALCPHPGSSSGFSCTTRSRRPPRTPSPQESLPCLPAPKARPPPCPAFPRSPVSKVPGNLMRNEDPGLRPRPQNSLKMGQTLCSWRTARGSPELPCGDPQPVVSAQPRLPLPPASKLDTLPAFFPRGRPPHSQDHVLGHKAPASDCRVTARAP